MSKHYFLIKLRYDESEQPYAVPGAALLCALSLDEAVEAALPKQQVGQEYGIDIQYSA